MRRHSRAKLLTRDEARRIAVICFGAAFFCGTGLVMAALSPLGVWGDPILWAPFTGMFLLSTYLLLRR